MNLKESKSTPKVEWGAAEDLQLLELRQDRKSWDYIAGRLEGKGKDLAGMKARFNELGIDKARDPSKEHEKVTGAESNEGEKQNTENEKQEGSSTQKGKTKDKGKGEAESDTASKKSEKGSTKTNGNLKSSLKGGRAETNGAQEALSNEAKKQSTPVEKAGYVGKNGRGEVRFVGGYPFLFKHAGGNAEPLDAEAVSHHYFPVLCIMAKSCGSMSDS